MTKASKFANVTVHEPPTQDEKEAWFKASSRIEKAKKIADAFGNTHEVAFCTMCNCEGDCHC
jgi:hypothetical protein